MSEQQPAAAIYAVRMNDSDTVGPWRLGIPIVLATPKNQDDDTCYYDVIIAAADAARFEAAMDASDAVISFSRIGGDS